VGKADIIFGSLGLFPRNTHTRRFEGARKGEFGRVEAKP